MSTTPEAIGAELARLKAEEERLWNEHKKLDEADKPILAAWNEVRQKLKREEFRSETVAELRKEILAELLAQKENETQT